MCSWEQIRTTDHFGVMNSMFTDMMVEDWKKSKLGKEHESSKITSGLNSLLLKYFFLYLLFVFLVMV